MVKMNLIMQKKKYLLKITCQDRKGIVAEVSSAIFNSGGFIHAFDQFSDPDTNGFFMRAVFETETEENSLREEFKRFNMTWDLRDLENKPNLLILCSKERHCLNNLLNKQKTGLLPANISLIISNHTLLEEMAHWYNLPFYHLPITPETKTSQEAHIKKLIKDYKIDYIVLARYMQILSPEFCTEFAGKIINIHHSFLPSFKGANPYLQAYERGVKVIGATAHFVTPLLDEGPIIHQETISVDHSYTAAELARNGADVEAIVLSKAVKYVVEGKVFIDKNKTIVFK
jgi:formyltetrahydrofolate deformylase